MTPVVVRLPNPLRTCDVPSCKNAELDASVVKRF